MPTRSRSNARPVKAVNNPPHKCPHAVQHAMTDNAKTSARMMAEQADHDDLPVLAKMMRDRLGPCIVDDEKATV